MNLNKEILIDRIPETIGNIKNKFTPCIKAALKSILKENEIESLIEIVLINLSQVESMSLHSLQGFICQELKVNCIKVKRTSINMPTKALLRIFYLSEDYNHIPQALELNSIVSLYVIDTLGEWKDMFEWVKENFPSGEKILTDIIVEWVNVNQSSIDELTEHIPEQLKEFMSSLNKATVD